MTGPMVTMASGNRGVGKTTATANLRVGLAALGEEFTGPESTLGPRDFGLVLVLENRNVTDLRGAMEERARPMHAMLHDTRSVADFVLGPASGRRRLG